MPHAQKVKQPVQSAKAKSVKYARATSTKSAKAKLRVVALVPAHNEEDIIKDTIESLMGQTWPLEYALIIADNCTDNTIKIVKKYQKKYGSDRLRLMKTVGNTHKKAGALNQGFLALKGKRPAFVFGMDADTILHPSIIEAGVKQFEQEPKTGGICSAYRTLPLKADATR